MGREKNNQNLAPFQHRIDGKLSEHVVNVDSRKLTPGTTPGTVRAYSTVYAPSSPRDKFKDIHQGRLGRIVAAEGETKQTWINFSDAQRAQHYVVTYSQQHIGHDLKQSFNIAQQAAAVGEIMQRRKAQAGRSAGFSSLKTAVQAAKVQNRTLAEPTLFEKATERTRGAIAENRLDAWGDAGPVIRAFDVDRRTATQVLAASVVEGDKKKTRSDVINVDQSKAANQIGIAGKAKQHLFKELKPASLDSVVFNPERMGKRFAETSGRVDSLHEFEQAHGLRSTVGEIASRQPHAAAAAPAALSIVERRSLVEKKKR